MGAEYKASIEFSGQLMRYAEIQSKGADQNILRRLGSCEFDFDLVAALSGASGLGQLRAISDSLQDVFGDSDSESLGIVLNSSLCDSFFTLASSDSDEEQIRDQIHYESELLRSDSGVDWGDIRYEPVRTQLIEGREHTWFHVIRVSSPIIARLETLLIHLPIPNYTLTTTYRSVGSLMESSLNQVQKLDEGIGNTIIALGCFDSHLECSVVDKDKWIFGHSEQNRKSNNPSYYTASILKLLKLAPKQIGNIFLYGEVMDRLSPINFEQIFRYAPSKIDPFIAFDPPPTSAVSELSSEEYAACLGAALKRAA